MTLTIHDDLEQGTEQWHAVRRGVVTASVVGRLIASRGVSAIDVACPDCHAGPANQCLSKVTKPGQPSKPIKTFHPERVAAAVEARDDNPPILSVSDGDEAHGLTLVLAAERITGNTDPTWVSQDMLRGQMHEPFVRDLYSQHFAPVEQVGFMVRNDWGFPIGFSPDGLVGDDGIIEIKDRRQKKQLSTVLEDTVPPENMAQIQAGLLVSGRSWCDYVSHCGGMHLYRKRVLPDDQWFDVIVAAVERFEKTADQMQADYAARTTGMPMTERLNFDLEMVV